MKSEKYLAYPIFIPFAFTDVIHTVGPIARGHINGSHKEDLANCYKSSLKLVKENNIRSVVSTFTFFISYSFSAFIFQKSVLSKTRVENHFQNFDVVIARGEKSIRGLNDNVKKYNKD